VKGASRFRIGGGAFRGLTLCTPPKFHSRPTQEKVRQALFSSLAAEIPDACILDLYSGSGALGIEALSHGAASVHFVDNHPNAIRTIRANLDTVGIQQPVTRNDAVAFCRQAPPASYDVILLDPPYDETAGPLHQDPIVETLPPLLRPGGLIVWEHAFRRPWQDSPHLSLLKTKRYGDSALTFLRPPAQSV